MTTFLIVTQIILSVCIVIVVILQKSSSIGLGAYSGSNDSLFGARGPASFLAKITMTLGLLFLANTIALGYVYNNKESRSKSVLDNVKIPAQNVPLNVPQNLPNTLPDSMQSPLQNSALPKSSPLLNNAMPSLTPSNIESNSTESSPQTPQK